MTLYLSLNQNKIRLRVMNETSSLCDDLISMTNQTYSPLIYIWISPSSKMNQTQQLNISPLNMTLY